MSVVHDRVLVWAALWKRNKTYIVIECTDSDRESGSGSSTVRVQISWLIDRPSCKQSDCSCFTLNFYFYFYFYFSFVLSEQRAASSAAGPADGIYLCISACYFYLGSVRVAVRLFLQYTD